MNGYRRSQSGIAEPAVSALSKGDVSLCDKMDIDSEWPQAPPQSTLYGYGFRPEVAQSFEFDIHDYSVSEVNR